MSKTSKKVPAVKNRKSIGVYMKRYWQLYLLLFLPMLYLIIFKYVPMVYIQIAFKKYSIVQSVWEMPLAAQHGFEYFIKAFKNKDFLNALRNTLVLNLLDLIVGFPAPIIFALILNELVFTRFKRVVQTIAYMPHFLSWLQNMGLEAVHFLDKPGNWIVSYILIGVWQNFGWGSIVYLAAIAGINPELYEAASVDGAGRFKKMWHITLPGIRSTIVVLLIMNLGNILGSGFDRPFAFQNNMVMNVANVISTFVYTNGIKSLQFSLTTAVGLFQSVICVIFLLLANWISRRLGERGIW